MAMFDFGKKGGQEAAATNTNVPVSQVLAMKAQGMNNNQIANQLRVAGYSLTQIRDALAQADIKSAVVPGFGEQGPGGMMQGGPVPGMESVPGMPDMMQMPDMPQFPGMPGGMGMPAEMEMPPLPEVPQQPPAFSQQQMQPMQQMQAPMQSQMSVGGGRAGFSMEQLVNELQRVIEEIIEEKWAGVDDKLNALDMWKVKLEGKITELSNKVSETTARVDEFSKGMMTKTDEYHQTMEEVGTEMEAVEKLMGKLVPSLAEEIKELRDVVDKMKKK